MKITLALLLLLTTIIGSAANKTKSWSDGALQWDDFKGVTVIDGVPSYLKPNLDIKSTQQTVKGRVKLKVAAIAYIDCDKSFANIDQRTDQRLRYHQIQFDLLELFRRRLQTELNTGMTGKEADERLKQYQSQYQSKIDEITVATDNGKREPRIKDYEYYVSKQLNETYLPQINIITPGDWTYGALLGTGATFPIGNLKDAFSSTWTFRAGLGIGYKRLKLDADITYSQPKILNPNIFDVPLQSIVGTYATNIGVSLTLGYTVFQTKNFSITPRAGAYWSSYSWNAGNYEEDKNGILILKEQIDLDINNFNWCAGIDFDYHFYTTVGKMSTSATSNRQQYISSIRLSPFVGRAVYKRTSPQLSGCQVGITISYTGVVRSLGIMQ